MSTPLGLSADLRKSAEELLTEAAARGELAGLAQFLQPRLDASDGGSAAQSDASDDANHRASSHSGPGSGEVVERFGMIGGSAPMLAVYDLIAKVAPSGVSVLIQGETGTGKELVAKALHENSARAKQRLLAENCAAVPENLLESELFGHKKGSFTGAVDDRSGHFVAADGGTVFLDEIGDMPLAMQSKLLRVLQDGEVRPVGSNKSQKVDVRVLAATHKDLPAAVEAGEFRQDLLFRLNVITIYLPPLRERTGDVGMLARGLLPSIAEDVGREAVLTDEAIASLEAYTWPGNVRELENELRRAVALSDGTIRAADLSPRVTS